MIPKKLSGICRLSAELISDSSPAAETIINELFSSGLAFFRDDALVNGNGALRPLGILQSPALITVNKTGGQAARTVSFQNLVEMFSRLPDSSKNAPTTAWLINGDCFPQILGICQVVGTGGGSAFLGTWTQGAVGPYPTSLFGKPIFWTELVPTLGTVGDVILGDFSYYLVGERGGIEIELSRDIFFTSDEVAVRWKLRIDGHSWVKAPLTPRYSTTTVSPFIALETRA